MRFSRNTLSAFGTIVLSCTMAYSQGIKPDHLDLSEKLLIHCTPGEDSQGWNVPCFRFTVNVVDDHKKAVSIPSGFTAKVIQTHPAAEEWVVLRNLDNLGQSTARRKRYVLILFDVSGSMNEASTGNMSKFEAAKMAADRALNIFTSGTDLIAVVPFDSKDVAKRIRGATFAEDIQTARRQLSELPQPTIGNTALYSAVDEGIDLLSRQDRESKKVLIVMTDGKNDLPDPKYDDKDLLSDIQPALEAKGRNPQITVYTVGFGKAANINEESMKSLASDKDKFFLAAAKMEELLTALTEVFTRVVSSFTVTAGSKDAPSFETLGTRKLKLQIKSGELVLDSDEFLFTSIPTAFGMRTTYESANTEEAQQWITEFRPPRGGPPKPPVKVLQILTFVFYAIVITVLWVLLPRAIWPAQTMLASDSYTATSQPIPPVETIPYGPQGNFDSNTDFGLRPGDRTIGEPRSSMGRTNPAPTQSSRLRMPGRKDQE